MTCVLVVVAVGATYIMKFGQCFNFGEIMVDFTVLVVTRRWSETSSNENKRLMMI